MKNPDLISVLLPAFNAEKYLAESLESIQRQTHSNIEIVVIDDGSTDSTLNILQAYAKNDGRFRVFSKPNEGLVKALNYGLRKCKGTWIARMDADDIAAGDRLQKQLRYGEKNDLDIVTSWHKNFGENTKTFNPSLKPSDIPFALMLFKNPISHPTALLRKSSLHANPYNDQHTHAEDMGLWVELVVNKKLRAGIVTEYLLRYRTHPAQVSRIHKKTQISTMRAILTSAVSQTDNKALSENFHLHYDAWISRCSKPDKVDTAIDYTIFLQALYHELKTKHGHSDLIYKHWRRLMKKNPQLLTSKHIKTVDITLLGASKLEAWKHKVNMRYSLSNFNQSQ